MYTSESAGQADRASNARYRHNLPLFLPSLIGRERDLDELASLLDAGSQLVTLVGVGGCGKTRLALAIAHKLLDRFADGIWLVDLAPLAEPDLVSRAVADAVDVHDRGHRPPLEALAAALRESSMLIVLDNCEHLISACAQLSQVLLHRCRDVRILATSREPLRIQGEIVRPVMPLGVPPEQGGKRLVPELARYPAVELFVTRAQAVDPTFQLSDDTAEAVRQVCARLGGLPLALELAAARVRVLAVAELAARLEDVFRVLGEGSRLSPARHQTLKAALDWSYGLLTPPEQILLRRLAVFAGGWELEAAETVCAGNGVDGRSVLDLLTHLVDKSLVGVERRGQETRYRLLEPIRQYADEHLTLSPEREAVLRRYADYHVALAEAAETRLEGVGHLPWLQRLEDHLDEFRTVLRRSMACGEHEIGLRLAAALWPLWDYRGHMIEGQQWLEQLLRCESENPRASPSVRARALRVAAWQAFYRQMFDADTDPARPIAYFTESLALARILGDRVSEASALTGLGAVDAWSGQSLGVQRYLDEGIRLWRELCDSSGLSFALWLVGLQQFRAGNTEQASVALEQSLSLAREMGHVAPLRIGTTLLVLALVARVRGDQNGALERLLACLEHGRTCQDNFVILQGLQGLASLAIDRGEPDIAVRLFSAAESLRQANSWPAPDVFHPRFEHDLAAARVATGPARFETLWAAGQGLPIDEAIEYARAAGMDQPNTLARCDSLTAREREVAALLAEGMTNRQIAERLVISEKTAAVHVEHILAKLDLRSRWQVADALKR